MHTELHSTETLQNPRKPLKYSFEQSVAFDLKNSISKNWISSKNKSDFRHLRSKKNRYVFQDSTVKSGFWPIWGHLAKIPTDRQANRCTLFKTQRKHSKTSENQ